MSTSKTRAARYAREAVYKELEKQAKQLDLFPDQIDYSALSTATLAKQAARLIAELQRRCGGKEGRLYVKGVISGEREIAL